MKKVDISIPVIISYMLAVPIVILVEAGRACKVKKDGAKKV